MSHTYRSRESGVRITASMQPHARPRLLASRSAVLRVERWIEKGAAPQPPLLAVDVVELARVAALLRGRHAQQVRRLLEHHVDTRHDSGLMLNSWMATTVALWLDRRQCID